MMSRVTLPLLGCLLFAPTADAALTRFRSASATVSRNMMAELYPFYHTTDAIREELANLATKCPGMTLQSVQDKGDDGRERSVDVVTVKAEGSTPVNKNFLLFGEHARELISPESGLHLVKTLCGQTSLSARAAEVLKDSEFQIVVNGNPASRQKVEHGDFCLRTDPEGVDLNRNWDEGWDPDTVIDSSETNPGKRPFSEAETRIFKELVKTYRPSTFLTIHSGTKGMYMPWAYDMEHLAQRNEPQMMEILKTLDKSHCECPFGAAGKEVGYSCPGTCLDWVYDKLQTPYAFAFEIYTGQEYSEDLKERWEEKVQKGGAFYQVHSHLGHRHFRELYAEHPSSFIQTRASHHTARARCATMSPEDCFSQFNPREADEYETVINNWSGAYLDMAALVAANLKRAGRAANVTV